LSRRTGIILAIIGLGLVVVGILVITNIIRRSLQPLPAPTPPPPLTEQVVVTTHDLALGGVINTSDVTLAEVPVELVPRGAMMDVEAVTGRITKIPLIAGEMVLSHHLADPTNQVGDLAFVIEDNQVLMAFPINNLMTELQLVKRGDLVDILVSISETIPSQQNGFVTGQEQETEERLFTFDALQRVVISAVVVEVTGNQQQGQTASPGNVLPGQEATPQPTPIPSRSETRPQAILLALDPQDALVLKHLKDDGATFDFVLRAPTSDQLFELDPVMPEYLIDRYQLEINR
jgi:Flp pilus assembly protein CpaB